MSSMMMMMSSSRALRSRQLLTNSTRAIQAQLAPHVRETTEHGYDVIITSTCSALGIECPTKEWRVITPDALSRLDPAPAHWRTRKRGIPRQWRVDYAWPDRLIALEVEGLTRAAHDGRHQSFVGAREDCAKYSALAVQGWRLLRYTPDQLRSGLLMADLKTMLVLGTMGDSPAPPRR